jgi:hypothetical protein
MLTSGSFFYVKALGQTLTAQQARRRAMSGSKAWVFMLGGDLIVCVIGTAILGLAYWYIGHHLRFGLLAYCLSFSGWFLSPNTH